MPDEGILLLKGDEIKTLLEHRELDILQSVRAAYVAHDSGKTNLPQSSFLKFPEEPQNRIIALPAYLGSGSGVAGIKWIASFPNNLSKNLERASAVLLLNSLENGRVKAILESSVISAKRTAASAALAAQTVLYDQATPVIGLIGCGLINFETLRFLKAVWPTARVNIFDLNPTRAAAFESRVQKLFGDLEIKLKTSAEAIFNASSLVALATTAAKPHTFDLFNFPKKGLILHTSLRDLSPELILGADNIVDDIEHVSRAQTSIHLAEQRSGKRDFISATLGEMLRHPREKSSLKGAPRIFSPFGLGILDLAVGSLTCDLAAEQEMGTIIPSFNPTPWTQETL